MYIGRSILPSAGVVCDVTDNLLAGSDEGLNPILEEIRKYIAIKDLGSIGYDWT